MQLFSFEFCSDSDTEEGNTVVWVVLGQAMPHVAQNFGDSTQVSISTYWMLELLSVLGSSRRYF